LEKSQSQDRIVTLAKQYGIEFQYHQSKLSEDPIYDNRYFRFIHLSDHDHGLEDVQSMPAGDSRSSLDKVPIAVPQYARLLAKRRRCQPHLAQPLGHHQE